MKKLLWILLVAAAAAAGWLAGRGGHLGPAAAGRAPHGAEHSERRILFYQSAMHPWIKSDRPGSCTICGMALTPVFEGESGIAVEPGVVALTSNAITVLHVASAEVTRGPLVRSLSVAGWIDDDDSRHRVISATVAGRVEALHVPSVGAEVEAGRPLARFYSPMLLEAERQFVAMVRGAAADAAPLREAAALRLRQLGLTPAQIEALPLRDASEWQTEIVAPVSGTVVERFVYAGQYVMEGEKLFEIADLDTMWFQFEAYEQDLPWLKVGQEVEVRTPALPGRALTAPIRFIDPNLSAMTRSTKVRVELENPTVVEGGTTNRLLRHRLYAEGRVRVETDDVLRVPRAAVLATTSRAVVYVDRGAGAYEQREVRLGRFGDSAYEVLAGLEAGERVVIHGNLMLDAQAQLNQTIAGTEAPAQPAAQAASDFLPALDVAGTAALRAFLAEADAVRVALAADDLPAYRARLAPLAARGGELRVALGGNESWAKLRDRVVTDAPADPADLRAARRDYHRMSAGWLELARAARRTVPEHAGIRIYQCPMTSESFEGAPPRAQWFQMGPPLRNPWFGAAMLDCGSEVKP